MKYFAFVPVRDSVDVKNKVGEAGMLVPCQTMGGAVQSFLNFAEYCRQGREDSKRGDETFQSL